jgi:hypothetical protein
MITGNVCDFHTLMSLENDRFPSCAVSTLSLSLKARPGFDAIESERLGSNVVLTRMRGHMTRALAEQQFEQFRSLVIETPQPAWVIEQLELTGFDPGAVPAGARWFGSFKDRGGERVVIVSTLSAARMVAASLAFAVHAKVSCCDTLKEAYELAGLGAVEARPSVFSLKPSASKPPVSRR